MPNFAEHKFAIRQYRTAAYCQAVFVVMKIATGEKPLAYAVESDRRFEDLGYVHHHNK
jgi:hypothetical protein